MANLIPNLKTFLSEMQPYVEPITEKEGKIILTLKQEVLSNPDKYLAFTKFFNPLKKKLRLEYYLEQKFITKPCRLPGLNYDLDTVDLVQFHIDTTALHVDRLKDFFQQGTSKAEVTESIGFLLKNGWTEKEFQSEIGRGRSTFFRYLPKTETSTSEPKVTMEVCNQSTNTNN